MDRQSPVAAPAERRAPLHESDRNGRAADRAGSAQILRALRPVDVTFTAGFWASRLRTNRRVTLRHEYALLKKTGRIDAFRLDWQPGMPNRPHYFWDSDVAKWIEAASYALATHRDRHLESQLDEVIQLIAGAQQPDGYLNVYFTIVEPQRRWTNLRDLHELYCAGHLIEAAVAHHQATGTDTLLEPLMRYADHIDARFGPGRGRGYPGHEELELALVKLSRAVGERRYLDLARHFIDMRGQRPHYYDDEARARGDDPRAWAWTYTMNQSHLPVRQQKEAVGHAVRAMYLYSGMADVAADTGDAELLRACRGLWQSTTARKMYVTGGIGSLRRGEALGPDYFLPNESAYAETCAAIGLIFFAQRMLHIERDAGYADVIERALYNGVLASVSLDGKKFFYENPLASGGAHHRQPWFDCACCPPNLARLLASLGSYCYAISDRGIYVNLYAATKARIALEGKQIRLSQQTRYPWDGSIKLAIDPSAALRFDLYLRIPGWCRRHRVHVNGKVVAAPVERGYARLHRTWARGDVVTLRLDMPVERIAAHPRVAANSGRVALQRGPLVYCVEQCDHRFPIELIRLPNRSPIRTTFSHSRLGGAVLLRFDCWIPPVDQRGQKNLYATASPRSGRTRRRVSATAVPFHLWDNRSPGAMAVWLLRESG